MPAQWAQHASPQGALLFNRVNVSAAFDSTGSWGAAPENATSVDASGAPAAAQAQGCAGWAGQDRSLIASGRNQRCEKIHQCRHHNRLRSQRRNHRRRFRNHPVTAANAAISWPRDEPIPWANDGFIDNLFQQTGAPAPHARRAKGKKRNLTEAACARKFCM